MQFDITIIQVTETKDKKNSRGGVFNAVDVVYKREGKVEAKSFPDWANAEIYPTLKGLAVNGEYTVTTEKVGEYWKWLSVIQSDGATPADTSDKSAIAPPNTANAPSSRPQTGTGKVLGSNYETREERQQRQKLIVAQSSLSAALEYAKAREPKGTSSDPTNVLVTAEQFYNWVFSIATKDLSDIENDPV